MPSSRMRCAVTQQSAWHEASAAKASKGALEAGKKAMSVCIVAVLRNCEVEGEQHV